MKAALALLLAGALGGCAGSATFDVRPFRDETTGQMVCCAFHALDWRDIGALTVDASKSADGSLVVHYSASAIGATAPLTAQGAVISNVSAAVGNTAAAIVKLAP